MLYLFFCFQITALKIQQFTKDAMIKGSLSLHTEKGFIYYNVPIYNSFSLISAQ
jgi:hypothetical protein